MAVRQMADRRGVSYEVRACRINNRPGIIFYQRRSPDRSLTSTFPAKYWVHRVNKVDKLVWRDVSRR